MQIRLLGSPALFNAGQRFEHPSRKAMALLAYLAMRADEHISRGHLAALLWGDSGEEQARANLRQTLTQLRKLFQNAGRDPIMVPFDKIVLCAEGIEIDARIILNGLENQDLVALADKPAFLEGFFVSAPEFENWMLSQRSMIQSRLLSQLEQASIHAFEQGLHTTAAACLSAALTIDPLQEKMHRALMQALAAQGRSDEALSQYERCQQTLARELGVQPDMQTRKLASEIRMRRLATTREARLGVDAAPEFRRFPDPTAALLFVASPRAPSERRHERLQFANAESALSAALDLRRRAEDPNAITLAAVPDTGFPEQDRRRCEAFIAPAKPGMIIVAAEIYEQFRHWSPFEFEQNVAEADNGVSYRLISEIPRHRLQISPTVAAPQIALLSEFSIVVLPLQDRSPNAGEFALGDVLSEEITYRLSKYRNLTVTAPSAGQAFKKHKLPIEQARATLGVNYLVDGSIIRDGDDLRVRLTLIDLRGNGVVFNHRFDGAFREILSQQSELVDRIATAVFRGAERAELRRAERMLTNDIGAYDLYLRGLAAHRRGGISPDNARDAFAYFSRAIDIDPKFARALAWRICSAGWYAPEYLRDAAPKDIQFALSIDEQDAEVQRIAGFLHLFRGEYEDCIRHIERAVDLNPSDAYLRASSAVFWAYSGEPRNGLKHIERAMLLDPFLPSWCVEDYGVVLYSMGAYAKAVESLQRLPLPSPRALAFLAASQVASGRSDLAKLSVERIRHIDRDYSVDRLMMATYYRREADKTALRQGLQSAGLN
jgi:DNA-binding SARP family transcriptional activator/TolB-like protein